MSNECAEIREMAAMIVRDYLTGPWKKVTPNNIVIQRVSGGLSNWLYQITLPATCQNQSDTPDPKTVLLRFHGQVLGETAFEHIIMESVIFTLLSERKLGPKLHGVFPGGRIEEFIQSRSLQTSDMWNPKISSRIAEKMAQIHSLNVPISKKIIMFDLMTKWLEQADELLEQSATCDLEMQKYFNKFKNYNLHAEISWLRQYLTSINSPVVFCHNDLQEGNILITNESTNSKSFDIVLIDYEYGSYNFRGFDLANHFLEYTISYAKKEYPHYEINPSSYPSAELQVKFIREYLRVYDNLQCENKRNTLSSLEHSCDTETLKKCNVSSLEISDKEAQLLKEVSAFRLASHMLWGLWSAMRSQAPIEFGYWEYCISRLDSYFETKKELLFEVPGNKRKKP